jgi:glycosyltransferase involved in cell wall biosynthesis
MHHGVPDRFASLIARAPREQLVLTVGNVDRANLERKGLRAFVDAAGLLPELAWVIAGKWIGEGGVADLRARAGANVTLTGWIDDPELDALYARAAVYVQASVHEGFGVSVAEAMLAGCVPVVTRAGALPEVVGDAGVIIAERSPQAIAAGVRDALERSARGGGEAARKRALERFPVSARAEALWSLVEGLPAGRVAATRGERRA